MQRQRVYLFGLGVGLPALVLTYVLVGRDDPVTRFGWPPLLVHLVVAGWLLLRRPHRVVAVQRATLVVVTVLLLARMAYHCLTKDPDQAWLALSPGTFMGLVLLVVFGYLVLGTAGGLRWAALVVAVSTGLAVATALPQGLADGRWAVLVSMLRAEVYVVVTAVFVHARPRVKDDAAAAGVEAQRMRDLAHRDPLTGLPNRRRTEDLLTGLPNRRRTEDLLNHHVQRGDQLAVVSLDLDWFKTVNDEHGHAVGDQVLHHLATALRDAVPTGVTVTAGAARSSSSSAPGPT